MSAQQKQTRASGATHRAHQVLAVLMVVLGVALVARGVLGGVWPLSLQLIAGILLLLYAGLRWRYIL